MVFAWFIKYLYIIENLYYFIAISIHWHTLYLIQVKEKCIHCGAEVLMADLRKHVQHCKLERCTISDPALINIILANYYTCGLVSRQTSLPVTTVILMVTAN